MRYQAAGSIALGGATASPPLVLLLPQHLIICQACPATHTHAYPRTTPYKQFWLVGRLPEIADASFPWDTTAAFYRCPCIPIHILPLHIKLHILDVVAYILHNL